LGRRRPDTARRHPDSLPGPAMMERELPQLVPANARPQGMDPGLAVGKTIERSPSYGVAAANEACSEASTTQALRRLSPRIAPVTLSTFPTGQDASCTKAIS
jgi:hypothetical protein